ncbi:glutathione S-transferase family protein [Alphaproteobacteria bacterium]|jgi:glutathione S-transferase|nr:glutathione S-transferase family protein [Alphaproteobacteria bacterium]
MLVLHYCSNSRAERVLWLLEELKLQYSLNKIKFHPSELKSEEHRSRHPLGRIPVLEDNNIIIYESGAIIEYLIAKHSDGSLKPAVNEEKFPQYLQWFHYCEGMIMPPMNTIVVHTLILPEERRNEEVLRQANNLLSKALNPVNVLLSDNEYLIDTFSGADFMLGHALYMSNKLGCVSEEMNNIIRYIKLLNSRKAFNKAINT